MKKSKILSAVLGLSLLAVAVGGCGQTDKNKEAKGEKSNFSLPSVVENKGKEIKDGTFKIGVVSDTPFKGFFNPVFYVDGLDYDMLKYTLAGTFQSNDLGQIKQDDKDGRIMYHFDKDKKEITLTINKDLKWSDGSDFTAEDIISTYELMGNPKYTDNQRYSDDFETIVGMKEYHEGKAQHISGIEKVDDKKVVLHLNKVAPNMLYGGPLIYEYLNHKQVADASKDFTKFADADLNVKPLSYGPYTIEKVVQGESVLFKKNEHFYKKDDVKVPHLLIKILPPASASESIKNNEVDFVEIPTSELYDKIKDFKNGKSIATPELYLSYIGFKLGKWDDAKGEVAPNPNAKLADPKLRQAFGYAVDWDAINNKIFEGLRITPRGSGYFPEARGDLYVKDGEKYTKNVEKAKELLKEAGLKDVNGDGILEDKNGKPLEFNFLIRNTGSSYDEALAQTFIDSWKAVGLNVKLVDNKLADPKNASKLVQGDSDKVDLYQFAWGLGSDPDPSGFFGKTSKFNLMRYTDSDVEKGLKSLQSDENFDLKTMVKNYKDFDKMIRDKALNIPFSWKYDIYWVSNRVSKVDITPNVPFNLYSISLLENK